MSTGNCGTFAASAGRNNRCELQRERAKFDSIDGVFAYQPLLWPSVRSDGRDFALPGGATAAGLLPAASGRHNANRSNGTARPNWTAPAATAAAGDASDDGIDAVGQGGAGHRSSEIRADVRSIPRAARYK